jgi:hypothetical protein
MTRLIALYPRAWRDRYEIELRALMAERPPDRFDRIDIVRGALDARLHPQLGSTNSGESTRPRPARLGGIFAVLGGALWAVAGVAFHGAPYNPGLGYKESGSAIVVALAAALVTGLAAFTVSRLSPGRHVVLSISAIATLLGALAMALPWPVVALGFWTTVVGTVMFGLVATPRLGPTGILLAGAAVLALGFNTEDGRALFLIPLGAAWTLFGIVMWLDRDARIGSARMTALGTGRSDRRAERPAPGDRA